jgi:predicted phosphohydrolase
MELMDSARFDENMRQIQRLPGPKLEIFGNHRYDTEAKVSVSGRG